MDMPFFNDKIVRRSHHNIYTAVLHLILFNHLHLYQPYTLCASLCLYTCAETVTTIMHHVNINITLYTLPSIPLETTIDSKTINH